MKVATAPWRLRAAGLLGVLAIVGAAGCGGGGGGSSNDGFSLSATRACLDKDGYKTAVVKNRYLPGTGENLRVQLSNPNDTLLTPGKPSGTQTDEYVFLVFHSDAAAALRTERKAVTLALQSLENAGFSMTRTAVKNGVGLEKNVFYYSASGALTKDERTKVESCLA